MIIIALLAVALLTAALISGLALVVYCVRREDRGASCRTRHRPGSPAASAASPACASADPITPTYAKYPGGITHPAGPPVPTRLPHDLTQSTNQPTPGPATTGQ